MNEYGGWDNCETPAEVWPEFIDYHAQATRIAETTAELDACRQLLKEGCNLLADEYDTIKASITMPDGTLSANPLDRWAVEKVKAIDEWILRAGKAGAR